MGKRLTEVRRRRVLGVPSNNWVVDILGNRVARNGYVQPDGTVGEIYEYKERKDAEDAEALYLTKNMGKHNGIETSAGRDCRDCTYYRLGSSLHINHCRQGEHYCASGAEKTGCSDFKPKTPTGEIRKFETGATRDTVEGKLSYVKALSPIVLQRYVQYLDAHRKQPDGSMRGFDNWKKGIPEETYLDGLGRHFVAVWLLAQGFPAKDNHGPVTLEDTLCALIFGASGWLHEILKGDNHLAG